MAIVAGVRPHAETTAVPSPIREVRNASSANSTIESCVQPSARSTRSRPVASARCARRTITSTRDSNGVNAIPIGAVVLHHQIIRRPGTSVRSSRRKPGPDPSRRRERDTAWPDRFDSVLNQRGTPLDNLPDTRSASAWHGGIPAIPGCRSARFAERRDRGDTMRASVAPNVVVVSSTVSGGGRRTGRSGVAPRLLQPNSDRYFRLAALA